MKKDEKNNNREQVKRSSFEKTEDFLAHVKAILERYESIFNKAASESTIDVFEKENQIKLSSELRAYFKVLNGLDEGEWISRLSPINKLTTLKDYPWFSEESRFRTVTYERHFVLGDLMIDSHQWVVKLNRTGQPEEILEMDFETKVANNICEFMEVFVNESPYALIGNEEERK
ncbi:MAG: hypothetical protein ACI8TA_003290 [Cyclobacteriaceae bacterium]